MITDENIQLGYSVSIQNPKIENGTVRYHLVSHYEELVGLEKHISKEGTTVMIPFTKTQEINTQITQAFNTWRTLGEITNETSGEEKITLMLCVRTIPPAINK